MASSTFASQACGSISLSLAVWDQGIRCEFRRNPATDSEMKLAAIPK